MSISQSGDGERLEETTQNTSADTAEARDDTVAGTGNTTGDLSNDEFMEEILNEAGGGGLTDGFDDGNADGIQSSDGENQASAREIVELQNKVDQLEAQLAGVQEQLLRKAADFENFRKRMNQEKQKAIDFANESLILDMIPMIDDFERAITSAGASPELGDLPAGKAMLDGISMIEKRFVGQLETKWGLKRFAGAGEPFDPNLHEAMFMDKSPDVQEPTVTEDFAKGYMLRDRVIRAAKVKVLMPGEKEN